MSLVIGAARSGNGAFRQEALCGQCKQWERVKGVEAVMPPGGPGASLGYAKNGSAIQNMLGHKFQKRPLWGGGCVCAVPVCAGAHEGQPQLPFLKPCPPRFEAGSITC